MKRKVITLILIIFIGFILILIKGHTAIYAIYKARPIHTNIVNVNCLPPGWFVYEVGPKSIELIKFEPYFWNYNKFILIKREYICKDDIEYYYNLNKSLWESIEHYERIKIDNAVVLVFRFKIVDGYNHFIASIVQSHYGVSYRGKIGNMSDFNTVLKAINYDNILLE